jgi:tRNA pseudouridine38-40 synthase
MRNFKLILSYDGTDFRGWQRQPGLRTVQQTLEDAILALTQARPTLAASSRTDAGVHALGQVVHFHTASHLRPEIILRALNALLPRDLRVLAVQEMPLSFHATLDATSKRYRYVIDDGPIPSPFHLRYSWQVLRRLDIEAMNRAGAALVGKRDFRSFETDWPNRTSSIRTIKELVVSRNDDLVWLEVEADGFLYNMVRAIAGTLSWVGSGKRPESWVSDVLRAQNRVEAGPTAPPQGLFLVQVRHQSEPG